MDYVAHETAIIEPGARIGPATKIWHFSHIMGSAIIGSHCSLGQNVFVGNNAIVGDHVKIQNNVSVYEGVVIEDYVFCGPSVVFTNVKTPRAAYPRNSSAEFLRTTVKHGASLGANATIVCGITIGEWAMIAAGAVVTKDVPPHALMAGVPAAIVGWSCECGVTVVADAQIAKCRECGRTYELSDGGIIPQPFKGGTLRPR